MMGQPGPPGPAAGPPEAFVSFAVVGNTGVMLATTDTGYVLTVPVPVRDAQGRTFSLRVPPEASRMHLGRTGRVLAVRAIQVHPDETQFAYDDVTDNWLEKTYTQYLDAPSHPLHKAAVVYREKLAKTSNAPKGVTR
jgi:hypothetical protein